MQCSMAWALHRTEKEKPAAGKTDYWRDFWRSGWDSNPRNLAVQLISSQSRYDHFDTAPYLSQHQHLGKRGELMGRTSKNIKLRIPEKPHKIKGFRSGSYRVATTISSAAPSTTRTTLRVYFRPAFFPEICSKIRWRENRREKATPFPSEIQVLKAWHLPRTALCCSLDGHRCLPSWKNHCVPANPESASSEHRLPACVRHNYV